MNTPEKPRRTDTLSSHLANVHTYIQRYSPQKGVGNNYTNTTRGDFQSPRHKYKNADIGWYSEFNITASWSKNDIVRVLTASNYTVDGTQYTSPLGTYICIQNVPPSRSNPFDGITLEPHLAILTGSQYRDPTVIYFPTANDNTYWQVWSEGTDANWNFRGEYNTGLDYAIGDVVVIRSDTNAGLYYCVLNNTSSTPSKNPEYGIYWISLTPGLVWN